MTKSFKRCTKCILTNDTPGILFGDDGVCNYCTQITNFEAIFPNNLIGKNILDKKIEQIKNDGRGKKYDAVIGVSGGCDSSYLMHFLTEHYGLRLLAVHFDNTWNTEIATRNIRKITTKLDIDLYTHVVDATEFDDIYLSFLRSGVKDIECPTDIGLATTMFQAAKKFKIKHKIDGHSFRTEGSAPMGLIYMDAKYIQSVHKKFGTGKIKTFPNLWLTSQLYYWLFLKIKTLRPLYYMNYDKEHAKMLLSEKYGWEWYGGHHLENRTAAFFHSYFLPQRWGQDFRSVGYSAQVRSGHISRDAAIDLMKQDPKIEIGLLEYFKKRLNLSEQDFELLMQLPKAHYSEFKTYKKTFEKMRPFIRMLAKKELVPWSFYEKYTREDTSH